MLKWVAKQLAWIVAHAVVIVVTIAFALKIWPDLKDKPPLEVLVAAAAGTVAARYLFFLFGLDRILLGWLPKSTSKKTDPVIGPAPSPAHTYEEWKADLYKLDGQSDLEDFLSKWRDVPPSMRPKRYSGLNEPPGIIGAMGPSGAEGVHGDPFKGPGEGREFPNHSNLPDHVVTWIDKHYERASQLWRRAHPGQDLPHPNPRQ